IENEIRRRLRDSFGTTLPRFDVLAQLARAPDGLTLGDLSRRMMVSAGNVTGLVDRLVADGLIGRQPVAGDRRAARVFLTAAGRARFDRLTAAHESWLREIFADLTEAEVERLMAGLARVKGSAQR